MLCDNIGFIGASSGDEELPMCTLHGVSDVPRVWANGNTKSKALFHSIEIRIKTFLRRASVMTNERLICYCKDID
ncbi:hypothetical protein E2C01_037282 [Portunus trituberculatus]|uniref:Uncharacterized protein n=1 Tax=Portunus trituberculatus TaxID=210409 RepID=A0A5B7F8Y7_PORTR|nr:hypothetical protein [Portunus trituberculatus]